MYQIIRFTFFETFVVIKQNLIFQLLIIYQQYLNLLNALLLYFEKLKNKQIDFRLVIINNTNHEKLIVISCL